MTWFLEVEKVKDGKNYLCKHSPLLGTIYQF